MYMDSDGSMELNCKAVVFILVGFSALLPPRAVADWYSPLSPTLSPFLNGICDNVECGKGRCHANLTYTFGFACECNPGWTQIHVGDHLRILPCIIPKYTDSDPLLSKSTIKWIDMIHA